MHASAVPLYAVRFHSRFAVLASRLSFSLPIFFFRYASWASTASSRFRRSRSAAIRSASSGRATARRPRGLARRRRSTPSGPPCAADRTSAVISCTSRSASASSSRCTTTFRSSTRIRSRCRAANRSATATVSGSGTAAARRPRRSASASCFRSDYQLRLGGGERAAHLGDAEPRLHQRLAQTRGVAPGGRSRRARAAVCPAGPSSRRTRPATTSHEPRGIGRRVRRPLLGSRMLDPGCDTVKRARRHFPAAPPADSLRSNPPRLPTEHAHSSVQHLRTGGRPHHRPRRPDL